MRETSFIEQNKDKWTEFEDLLKRKSDDPDKLSELYVQITDDLSYSRTYYPNRSVRVYLNGLAQNLFYKIYTNKKSRWRNFLNFWQFELPQIVYLQRKEMRLSLLVFLMAMGIGVLSSMMDDSFAAHILGESYVRMTEENIASGDPMAVYKQQGQFDMAMGITLNNLKVAFITFIFGFFYAIGSLAVLVYNGVMVGTFQYYFVEQGLFVESFLTIWVHGTLEISAIIIAGASGIVMGRGFVFPGTYSRVHAFRVSARRGLKMLLGIAPIIILAGIVEGFLTRFTDAPDIFRLTFILASLFFILTYFVWYPKYLHKKGKYKKMDAPKLPADTIQEFDYRRVKGNGAIFSDAVSFLKLHAARVFSFAAIGAVLYGTLSLGHHMLSEGSTPDYTVYNSIFDYSSFFYFKAWYLEAFALVFLSLFAVTLSYLLVENSKGEKWERKIEWKDLKRFFLKNILKVTIIVGLVNSLYFLPPAYILLVVFIVGPILAIWLFIAQKEKVPFFSALGRYFSLASDNWGKILGMSALLTTICGMMMGGLNSGLLTWYFYPFVSDMLFADGILAARFMAFISSLLGFFAFTISCGLMITSFSFLYFTLREIQEAEGLLHRIPNIGEKNQAFGIEKERRFVKD